MSMIKGGNTKPEIIVRKYLHGMGLRYRLHDKSLPGKPDLVFRKYKYVIFVNGCFFHGHKECSNFKWPQENKEFWKNKIVSNIKRDERINNAIKEMGWRVFTVWECELRPGKRDLTLNNLYERIVK